MKKANEAMTGREAAVRSLGEFRLHNQWDKLKPEHHFENASEQRREIALATQIINGVMQNMAYCDHIAAHYSSRELKTLHPRVLDILRVSIYQIVFLTRIPHSAAVKEGVKLTQKLSNNRAAGYINALLRRVCVAASDNTLPDIKGDRLRQLSVRYSHPKWLVVEFKKLLGDEGVEALLRINNAQDTPVTVQVNTLRATTDDVLSMLTLDGVKANKHEWLYDCIELHRAGSITRLGAFDKGYIYAQDAASKLAIIAAGPKEGDLVIDGCAAPGGKSFAAAIAMRNTGRIIACDLNDLKLSRVVSGAERMGLSIISTLRKGALSIDSASGARPGKDTEHPPEDFTDSADVVIADVPCSGYGVIWKKPEIRYKVKQETAELPETQLNILTSLSTFVKPGGVLLYCTCTVLDRENYGVITRFLRYNKRFQPEPFQLPGIGEAKKGSITLWPHLHGTDGFFICKMRKLY